VRSGSAAQRPHDAVACLRFARRSVEDDFPAVREVDLKLIELAKLYEGKIVTNDFNLNKVSQVRGVSVLNINELANALKPVVLPGEAMRVFILKEGKEYNQGVAYLDDGTMVVVDNAKTMISRTIDITVTSVLQTTAGKMIFGRFDDRVHSVHDKSSAQSERHERSREGGQTPGLVDIVRERLLHIHVHSELHTAHGHGRMHVVGRAHAGDVERLVDHQVIARIQLDRAGRPHDPQPVVG